MFYQSYIDVNVYVCQSLMACMTLGVTSFDDGSLTPLCVRMCMFIFPYILDGLQAPGVASSDGGSPRPLWIALFNCPALCLNLCVLLYVILYVCNIRDVKCVDIKCVHYITHFAKWGGVVTFTISFVKYYIYL